MRRAWPIAAVLATLLAGPARSGAPPDEQKSGAYLHVEELPAVVHRVAPIVPEEARRAGIGGTVTVQALVDTLGRVADARVVRSIPMLDRAALEAVRQWRFRPGRSNDRPAAVWVAIPIRFDLPAPTGDLPAEPREPAVRRTRVMPAEPPSLDERIADLRRGGIRVPSEEDAIDRERIVRAARRAVPPPEVPVETRARLERVVRSLERDADLEAAAGELAAVLDEAPWWADAYREMARVQERLGNRAEAIVCWELVLAADPDAADWERVRARLQRLRRALDVR